jgi:hypothetical protein
MSSVQTGAFRAFLVVCESRLCIIPPTPPYIPVRYCALKASDKNKINVVAVFAVPKVLAESLTDREGAGYVPSLASRLHLISNDIQLSSIT